MVVRSHLVARLPARDLESERYLLKRHRRALGGGLSCFCHEGDLSTLFSPSGERLLAPHVVGNVCLARRDGGCHARRSERQRHGLITQVEREDGVRRH